MRNLLLLSEPFGGGHTKAAEATAALFPSWNCRVVELASYLDPILAKHISKGYLKTVQMAPWLWRKIYSGQPTEAAFISYIYRKKYGSKLATLLFQTKPDLIITTHPFPALAISSLRKYNVHIPLIGIVTDFHVHSSWSLGQWDVLCIPSEEKPDWLQSTKRLVLPTGIPVAPDFKMKQPKAIAKKLLQLNEQKPVVLWMGGSEGICNNMEWIAPIQKDQDTQWIFVTGHNQSLYHHLKSRFEHFNHIKVYGYVDNITTLMDASDLLISKAGGITCSEAIHKELPIVLIPGLPGQEEENCSFLLRHGLAVTTTTTDILSTVHRILCQPNLHSHTLINMKRYKRSIESNRLSFICEALASERKVGT